MQRIVKLSDGTQIPVTMCGMADGVLWIRGKIGMREACVTFSDPEKLFVIVDTYDGQEDLRRVEWDGYTVLIHISVDYDGQTQIGLRKGNGI